MAKGKEVEAPKTLQEMILADIVKGVAEETPEAVTQRIIEQNAKAETLDDLFRELESMQDYVMVPFVCTDIGFRESSFDGSLIYAVLEIVDANGELHVVSCSSPDVWSKLLRLRELGALDTPVRVIEKQTSRGFNVLKLTRVSETEWDQAKRTKKVASDF